MANSGDLETVDFDGVDVLAAGGPYFGQGSPPEGDFYTEDDLRGIADNTRRLLAAGELRAPLKLGHGMNQRLARESGYEDGEMPALGWIENPRVENGRLLTDWKRVPKKLAALIQAGAFRTRSLELRSYVSQKDGGRVGPAIKGLALMGAKSPAVRTLDDVIALYHDEVDEGEVQTLEYGEVIWNPDLGYRWVQASISSALNPSGEINYHVADVGPESALVVNYGSGTDSTSTGGGWIVPFTITGDQANVAPADEWIRAQERWLERAREYADMSGDSISAHDADTKGEMTYTITEEQARALTEKLGLDPDEFDIDAVMLKAGDLRKLEEEGGDGGEGEFIRIPKEEWERVVAAAEAGAKAEKQLAETERDRFLEDAVKDGKLVPADLDDWKRRYDEQPEFTKEIVGALRPHTEFLREYGSDEDGRGTESESERALGDAFDSYMGIAPEDRLIGGKA